MASILVVHGPDDLLVALEALLSDQGHDVSVACVIDAALREIRRKPIDVLIVSIWLPEGHGAGLDLASKAVALRAGLKVLYVGGIIADRLKAQFVHGGRLLQKPFTAQALESALAELLGGREGAANPA